MASFILVDYTNPVLWEFGIISQNIVNGSGYHYFTPHGFPVPSAFIPPAYPLLQALLRLLFPGETVWLIVLQVIQVAVSACIPTALFFLGRLLFSDTVGRIAALIAVVYPTFIYMPVEFHPVSLYVCIGLLYIIACIRAQRKNLPSDYGTAGFLGGVFMLFRSEALLIHAIITLILTGFRPDRKKIQNSALFLLTSLIVVFPWTLRNYLVFGELIPITSTTGYNFWIGNHENASGTPRVLSGPHRGETEEYPHHIGTKLETFPVDNRWEIRHDSLYLSHALRFLSTHPGEWAVLLARKSFFFWILDLSHPKALHPAYFLPWLLMLPLVVNGVYVSRVMIPQLSIILVPIGVSFLVSIVFFVLPRYRMIIEPYLFLFAAQALATYAAHRDR